MKKTTFTFLLLLSIAITSFAQSSYIDSSFGVNGVSDNSLTDFLEEDLGDGFTVTNSGKIINVGIGLNSNNANISIVSQFNSNGSLDTSFANNGILELTTFWGIDVVSDQTNNLYISGISVTNGKLGVLKLDSSGNTDASFGINGVALINENILSLGYSIKVDPTGKFIVGGTATVIDEQQVIVARFNSNGTPDTTFGTNGAIRINISNVVTDEELYNINLNLFDDNNILISGTVYTPENEMATGNYEYNEFVTKINTSGLLDNSFGNNGVSIFYDITNSGGGIYASYILSNSKIFLTISGLNNSSEEINGLLKINANGTIDTSFGTNGFLNLVSEDFFITALFASILDNDIFVLGGESTNWSIVKINENGTIDTSFADSGILPVNFPGITTTDLVSNAVELSDGKILVSGYRENEDGFIMGRYFKENQQLSIDDNDFTKFKLYPNPAHNYLKIEGNTNFDSYIIYQMDGKLVLNEQLNSNTFSVNVSSLSKGIYTIKLVANNQLIQTIKFVKI